MLKSANPCLVIPAGISGIQDQGWQNGGVQSIRSHLNLTTTPQKTGCHRGTETMSKDKYPVLVVDDFAFLRNSVCKIIEKMGCAADAVASGQEALNQLKDNSYALIFMDCRMPGMDGYEATRAVRGRQYADCRADFKSIG